MRISRRGFLKILAFSGVAVVVNPLNKPASRKKLERVRRVKERPLEAYNIFSNGFYERFTERYCEIWRDNPFF